MNPVLKRIITALTTAALVVLAIVYLPTKALPPIFSVVMALAVIEFALLLKKKVPLASVRGIVGLLLGFAVIAGGLSALPASAVLTKSNLWMLYLIAIVKFSDMGGFAFGMSSAKLMKGGNHKLCPTISPNKSWEGLFGSVFASSVMSCAWMSFTHFGVGKALAFGAVAALVGTFGDLVESKFKRWVGVKDSSTMSFTNGMGGILDMFDSLLFAPAAIWMLIALLAA